MFMAGTSNGACRHVQPSPGVPVSGSCTPRKFSEKIALLTQRQAEDTAAFQEVMMDMTSTRLQVQRVQQARGLGPYYGGSLPNVNQIGRNPAEFQGQPTCGPDAGCSARRHPVGERNQGDGRVCFPVRPIRRHTNSPYHSVHLSPPPDPSWRRNWSSGSPMDKSQHLQPPITALNRTNSDSALHTSVRNTHTGGHLSPTHTLTARNRHSVFPYPVLPIEENVLEEGKQSRSDRKSPALSGRHKSSEIPGINILPSPDHLLSCNQLGIPSALSTSESLPDLSSLHLPSPQPAAEHQEKQEAVAASLGTACSTGRLPQSITDMRGQEEEFNVPGLSLQGSLSNPLLPSSLSKPNIQSSLSSHSLPASLSSASLNLSLSNRSLHSSPSNQSLQSFHSNSSLSSQSIQSAASLCSYSSGIGGSRSCSSSSLCGSPRQTSQSQVSLTRRRAPLSPLVAPIGGESRWHQAKQLSPVSSPTLSSITQGVLLNTQLPKEPRPPAYSHNPSVHPQPQAKFLPQTQTQTQPPPQPEPPCTQTQPDPVECPPKSQPPPQYGGLPPQQQSLPERPQQQEQKQQQNQQQQQQHQYLQNQCRQQQQHVELKPLPHHQKQDSHTDRQSYQPGGTKQPQVHSQKDADKQQPHQHQQAQKQEKHWNEQQQKHKHQENIQQQETIITQHTQPKQHPQQQNAHQQQHAYHQQQPLPKEHSLHQPHPHQHQQSTLSQQVVPKHGHPPQIQNLQDPQGLQTGPQPHQQLQQYHHHDQCHPQPHPQLNQTNDFPAPHYQMNRGPNEPLHHFSDQQPPLFYQHPQQPQTHQRDPQVHDGLQFQQFPLCQQQPIQDGQQPQQHQLCQQQQHQQQIQDGRQFQHYQLCQQQQQSQDGRQFHQYQLCQQQQPQQCPQDGRQFLSQHGHQFQQQHPTQQYWPNPQLPPYNQTSVQSLDVKRQNSCAPTVQGPGTRQEMTRRQYQTQNQQGKTWAQQKLQALKKQNQLTGSSLDTGQGLSDDSQKVLEPLQQQSYMGLHLTPSQTEALAQQLGPLSKLPVWGEGASQPISSDRAQGPHCSLQSHNTAQLHPNVSMGYEDMSSCLPMYGFQSQSDPFSLDDVTLNIDPLGLEELSMLADGHVVEDT